MVYLLHDNRPNAIFFKESHSSDKMYLYSLHYGTIHYIQSSFTTDFFEVSWLWVKLTYPNVDIEKQFEEWRHYKLV